MFKKILIKLKVAFVVFWGQLTNSCRMLPEKPEKVEGICYLCAYRGGSRRCSRSKELKPEADKMFSSEDIDKK